MGKSQVQEEIFDSEIKNGDKKSIGDILEALSPASALLVVASQCLHDLPITCFHFQREREISKWRQYPGCFHLLVLQAPTLIALILQ